MVAVVGERTPMRFSGVTSKVVDVGPAYPAEDPESLGRFVAHAIAMIEREGEMGAELLIVRRDVRQGRQFEPFQPQESFDPRRLFERQHLGHPQEIVRGSRRLGFGFGFGPGPGLGATCHATARRRRLANAFEQHAHAFAAVPIAPRDPFRSHALLELGAPVHRFRVWRPALAAAGETRVVERKAQEEVAPEVLVGRSIYEGVRATTGLGERGHVFEVAEREGALGQLLRHGRYHGHVTDGGDGPAGKKNLVTLFPGFSRPWARSFWTRGSSGESYRSRSSEFAPFPKLPGFPGRCFRANIWVATVPLTPQHATSMCSTSVIELTYSAP